MKAQFKDEKGRHRVVALNTEDFSILDDQIALKNDILKHLHIRVKGAILAVVQNKKVEELNHETTQSNKPVPA